MKCKHVKQKIDHFLIEKRGPLTEMASQHIAECPSCRQHYESTLFVSKLTDNLRDTDPLITESSKLTESIMLGINQNVEKKSANTSVTFFTSINVQRFLAAASICLFLIFGYEQYRVLTKITHLEKENQISGINSQIENANWKGTIEGFLLLKFKIQNKNPEKLFKDLRLEQYNNQEQFTAFKQVKQGSLSSKELNQVLGSSFSTVEANNLIKMIKSYDIEYSETINFIKN